MSDKIKTLIQEIEDIIYKHNWHIANDDRDKVVMIIEAKANLVNAIKKLKKVVE